MSVPHRLDSLQIDKLHSVLTEHYDISGGLSFPSLSVRPNELILAVNERLGGMVKDVRLNGSAAAYVASDAPTAEELLISDLDILYGVSFPIEDASAHFDSILQAVMECLKLWSPSELQAIPVSTMSSAYVSKLVKVPNNSTAQTTGDCWSLICLRSDHGPSLELKFVHSMRRSYEFTVDSVQLVLNDAMLQWDGTHAPERTPAVTAVCMHGDMAQALLHLNTKTIYIYSPEEVRGGGFLKYCRLLTKGYRLPETMPAMDVSKLERTMSTRFFIDFSSVESQHNQIVNYWRTHNFGGPQSVIEFLRHIHRLIKSVTRGNASERAGSLEMLVFLMDNLKYSSMHARPQPYAIQQFHHPHGVHMAQAVSRPKSQGAGPLHMVFVPPPHPYALVPMARTISLPHPLMHSSPEQARPYLYLVPHTHLLEPPLSRESSGAPPFPVPFQRVYPDTPPGSPLLSVPSDSESESSDAGERRDCSPSTSRDTFRERGRNTQPSGRSRRSLSQDKELLFGKARKMVVASDNPAGLAEQVLAHPSFCVNEFGFMGNSRSDGQTILMVACKYGRIACVRMLVTEYGADVNASGGLGRYTPLCYAAYHGHLDVVTILLENGADPSVRTAEGETAEEAARHNGNTKVADLIRSWGTRGQQQAALKTTNRRRRNGKSQPAADNPTWAELAKEQVRRIMVQAPMQYSAAVANGAVPVPLQC